MEQWWNKLGLEEPGCPIILKPSFQMVVTGSVASGKSTFIADLIRNLPELCPSITFSRIIVIYGLWQKLYSTLLQEIPIIEFYDSLSDELFEELKSGAANANPSHVLLVFDDKLTSMGKDKRLEEIFLTFRHSFCNTIISLQNFYADYPYIRSATRNSNYIAIFSQPRDLQMISTMGQQIFPKSGDFMTSCYRLAMQKSYGYLFLDLTSGTPDKLRVSSQIMPDQITELYLKS